MIKLEIEGSEYELAREWSEITFAQYIEVVNINKDKWNDLEKAVKIIAHISNKPAECEQSILKLSREDFEELASYFVWTNHPIDEFKSEKDVLEIDGKSYKIKKDYNKLSLGEMISVETLIENNKNLDAFEVAFGVLLRELDENGNEKEFNEDVFLHVIQQLKEKVMLLDIYNHISFFLSGVQISTTKSSKGFSIQVMEKSS
jgi:hypothetical protein